MNKPKYVLSQLVAFMDSDKFHHIVDKYGGNRYVKHFTYYTMQNKTHCPLFYKKILVSRENMCNFAENKPIGSRDDVRLSDCWGRTLWSNFCLASQAGREEVYRD